MIGDRINQLRTEQGITIELLSQATGVSRSAIQEMEAGITLRPHADTIKKLADALAVSPADLTAGHTLRLIDGGWWPPKRVDLVLEAVEALLVAYPCDMGNKAARAAVGASRISHLRRMVGLNPLESFPNRLDTPAQVEAYLENFVRDRPVPDKAPAPQPSDT